MYLFEQYQNTGSYLDHPNVVLGRADTLYHVWHKYSIGFCSDIIPYFSHSDKEHTSDTVVFYSSSFVLEDLTYHLETI
jgi:hypothetical protein